MPGCAQERGQRHSYVPAFLPQPRHGVAGVPAWPHSASHLLRLSPGLGCHRHQTRSAPSSLLPSEGRSCLRAPRANGQGTKNVTEMKRKQWGKKTIVKKKIVTKGKTTNSLAEYKDLESDGATTASLERRGHGHAPPTSSTTRFGALGAQRAGVRPSPCPDGEEEGWPGARTAQCSPHPRRGFGEGG